MKARRRNCVVAKLEGPWCWPSEHIGWSSSLWPTLHYLPITPPLRPQIIIRILLYSFLEGIFWLIPGCWAERSWWFLDKQLRDYFPSFAQKEIFSLKYWRRLVAGWCCVVGGLVLTGLAVSRCLKLRQRSAARHGTVGTTPDWGYSSGDWGEEWGEDWGLQPSLLFTSSFLPTCRIRNRKIILY